jgi:alkanesulfonate monooxygenase SsuD/methylene tetrahydromethanopterin reductase-like flavin-dependent oxidoreductase (luciferase family)
VAVCEGFPTVQLDGTSPSPLLLLAALAQRTSLRLATSVTILPLKHLLGFAYDGASLDQLTAGRLDLGVAVGQAWLQRRFGVDPSTVGDWMDEALQALKALWSGSQGFEG